MDLFHINFTFTIQLRIPAKLKASSITVTFEHAHDFLGISGFPVQ